MTDYHFSLAEILKVAAYLAQGARLPSYDKDDHKQHVPAWLLKEIEKAADDLRVQATALKRACDSLRPVLTTSAVTQVVPNFYDNEFRIKALRELGFTHRMENGDHVVEGLGLTFRHTSLFCLMSRIVIAMRDTQPPPIAEDYTDDADVFEYIRDKQARGYFTHPAIVKLMVMAQCPDRVVNK